MAREVHIFVNEELKEAKILWKGKYYEIVYKPNDWAVGHIDILDFTFPLKEAFKTMEFGALHIHNSI